METATVRRTGPGAYQVTAGRHALNVWRNPDLGRGREWIVSDANDPEAHNDPVGTKREAVDDAMAWLFARLTAENNAAARTEGGAR